MQATTLIETNIRPDCQSIHAARFAALTSAIEAALVGKCVSVTGLGRRSPRAVSEKVSIKQMDRLVGNVHLWHEARVLYKSMAKWAIGTERHPLLLVDWSPVSHDEAFHVLRASIPAGGRGKTIYEEVHPQEYYANPQVQQMFLWNLARVLPEQCQPIVVTDAGFKNPWFKAVESLGWDWAGRVRGTVQMTREGEGKWLTAKHLGYVLDQNEAVYMGAFVLAKTNPLKCVVYGLRKPPKGRIDKNKRAKRSMAGKSRQCAASQKEPWILATSLLGGADIVAEVIGAYTKRMQIEEAFRDTKDEYYGLGLNRSRSRSAKRFTVLLLINALALFVAWLIGKVAELRQIHWSYQANTVRNRRVLSFIFLGLRVLSRQPIIPTAEDIAKAQSHLRDELRVLL